MVKPTPRTNLLFNFNEPNRSKILNSSIYTYTGQVELLLNKYKLLILIVSRNLNIVTLWIGTSSLSKQKNLVVGLTRKRPSSSKKFTNSLHKLNLPPRKR